jgi:hypothetical protein
LHYVEYDHIATPKQNIFLKGSYTITMRFLYLLIFIFLYGCTTFRTTQQQVEHEPEPDALAYQAALSAKYLDPDKTILSAEKRMKLQELGGLPFFAVDPDYQVVASVQRFAVPEIVTMKTSSTRLAEYEVYALAEFELKGISYALTLYKSRRTDLAPEYQNLLFLPFKDATSGNATYGGGRYMDLPIPNGNTVVIDFNKAYHPYCAYTTGYSCPVVPVVNHLDIPIEAGIKMVDLGAY